MDKQNFSFMLDLLGDMSCEELKEQMDHVRSLRGRRKEMKALKNFDRSMAELRRFESHRSPSAGF